MDPFNPNSLGPDGLPRPPLPPQAPEEQQNRAADFAGEGVDLGLNAVDVSDGVGFIGDMMSGAADLAGSAISSGAEAMSSVASGAVDVVGSVASGAGELASGAAEGLGAVVEGAGNAAGGCSCALAIVFFFVAAGSAVAAVIR